MTLIDLGIESARHRATLSWSEEEPGSTAAGPVISLGNPLNEGGFSCSPRNAVVRPLICA